MTSELRPEIDVAADVIEANRPGAVLKGIAVIKAYGDDREAKGREEQAAELAKWKALAETLAGALEQMHRAVCHETGFAEAVRADSGVAYPWEPLDVAADASIKALTRYKEQRDA